MRRPLLFALSCVFVFSMGSIFFLLLRLTNAERALRKERQEVKK